MQTSRVVQARFPGNAAQVPRHSFQLPPAFSLSGAGLIQQLPSGLRQEMQTLFRTDFSGVRLHVGPQAASVGALALTLGTDIYLPPGYNPNRAEGKRLLAHELTHIVQQRSGRVRNPFGSGIALVQDPMLEMEAERMSLRACQGAPGLVQGRILPAPSRVLQPKGELLTGNQVTRIRDSQTYYCEITIDGRHNVKGSGGKPDDDYIFTTLENSIKGYQRRTDKRNPHAEDMAMFNLLQSRKHELRTSEENGERWLSVTITAAPCERCAQNLIAFA